MCTLASRAAAAPADEPEQAAQLNTKTDAQTSRPDMSIGCVFNFSPDPRERKAKACCQRRRYS
jgi:hypothetical protein